jgi:phosphomannomutase/phosphoglucomutase
MSYKLVHQPARGLFRAYDIRGVVGSGFDADLFYTLGVVLASRVRAIGKSVVAVGRDGRLSSPELATALIAGCQDGGCNVVDVGVVPSPVLYFAAHTLSVDAGLMVTGSHNPKQYNGLKMVIAGKTLTESDIQAIYQQIVAGDLWLPGGGTYQQQAIIPHYIADIQQRLSLSRPLKVVVDCGNGVAAHTAPALYAALGCEVVPLHATVDGNFPNHHPNPSVAENMQDLIAAVLAEQADLGLAFDGDADRLGVVTSEGKIIWPDRLMMLYSQDVLQRQPGAKVVFDVKCSSFLADVIAQHGGTPVLWRTGHSVLKAKMIAEGAALAGEMSGHIFFRENWYGFDDGVYAGARLLDILAASDQSLAHIFHHFPEGVNTPEILLPVADEKKFALMERLVASAHFPDAEVSTLDGLRVTFSHGWGLVRASNTTPNLTLRFESTSDAGLAAIRDQIGAALLACDSTLDVSILEGLHC